MKQKRMVWILFILIAACLSVTSVCLLSLLASKKANSVGSPGSLGSPASPGFKSFTSSKNASAASGAGLPQRSTNSDYTISNDIISVTLSKLHAGAVGKLTYRGREAVPWYVGKGGSLQSAAAFDVDAFELYNPTEAGAVDDDAGPSSSKWLELRASNVAAYTRNQMAFFMPPGRSVPSAGGRMSQAKSRVSDVIHSKRITMNYKGSKHLIHYSITFQCPQGRYSFGIFEMLTAFCHKSMSVIYKFENGKMVKVLEGANQQLINFPGPVGLATPDKSLCLAQVCLASPGVPMQGAFVYDPNAPMVSKGIDGSYSKTNSAMSQGVVGGPKLPTNTWSFEVVLAVGTVAECESALKLVAK